MSQVPFSAPIPVEHLPKLSVALFTLGFIFSVGFGVTKNSIVKELFFSIISSFFLSFCLIFTCLSVGLYL